MTKDNSFFRLHSLSIPVRGAKASIISDLQKEIFIQIPNILYDVLDVNFHNNFSIQRLKNYFHNNFSSGIDKYFDFLEKNNIGFFTDSPFLFKEIKTDHIIPNQITNSILEISERSNYNLEEILWELEGLGVISVEIRIAQSVSILEIKNCLSKFNESTIKAFNIIIHCELQENILLIYDLLIEINRINKIFIYSSQCKRSFDLNHSNRIVFINEGLSERKIENKVSFVCNLLAFCEAQNNNLALNKKVCIDKNGNIKNYLSHKQVFGNIQKDRLLQVISKDSFRVIWQISNDRIEKCKDCQYRFMCFSCSEINFEDNNKIYRTQQCSFNPFNNIWH